MARTAAAIWGSIGLFGLIVTLEPLRENVAHLDEMRALAAVAAAFAAALLLVPAPHLPANLFVAVPALMSLSIAGLAYAGGDERGDLTILFAFVVVFAAYFLSWRASIFQLALACALLTSRLFAVGAEATRVETVRFSMLLPALIGGWALVSLLKKSLQDREARLLVQEIYDTQTGLLSPNGLDRALDPELARARRHARPLSLIQLEVGGGAFVDADRETTERVATAIARSIVGRIRAEDRAARISGLRFAIIASETGESGAAVLARALAEQVRKRLLSVGYESTSLRVAIGWADYQQTDGSKQALIDEAEWALGQAVPMPDGIAVPVRSQAPPPPATVGDLQPAG